MTLNRGTICNFTRTQKILISEVDTKILYIIRFYFDIYLDKKFMMEKELSVYENIILKLTI